MIYKESIIKLKEMYDITDADLQDIDAFNASDKKKKLKYGMEKLYRIYRNEIHQLEFDEMNNLQSILGIGITFELLA